MIFLPFANSIIISILAVDVKPLFCYTIRMVRSLAIAFLFAAVGVGIGAWLFADTKPRSFLRPSECAPHCLSEQEILGLLGSVGVQRLSGAIPRVEKETDKTIVVSHPRPTADIHYVVIPKRDMKAVEDVAAEDMEYLVDAYATMGAIIKEQNLRNYKVVTNGPGFQTVGYLHFHLVSELPE